MTKCEEIYKIETEQYLAEIVEPTIRDFEQNPRSLRHAFLAAVTVYHTIDYLYGGPKQASNPRKTFRDESKTFGIVERVAHAFKHVQFGNKEEPKSRPLDVKGVITRPPGAIGEFAIGVSRIGDSVGGVTLDENVEIDILDTVNDAVIFLRSKLQQA